MPSAYDVGWAIGAILGAGILSRLFRRFVRLPASDFVNVAIHSVMVFGIAWVIRSFSWDLNVGPHVFRSPLTWVLGWWAPAIVLWAAYDLVSSAYQTPTTDTPSAPPTKCPSCHVENDADAKFCKSCGWSRTPKQNGGGRRRLFAAGWALACGALALIFTLWLPLRVRAGGASEPPSAVNSSPGTSDESVFVRAAWATEANRCDRDHPIALFVNNHHKTKTLRSVRFTLHVYQDGFSAPKNGLFDQDRTADTLVRPGESDVYCLNTDVTLGGNGRFALRAFDPKPVFYEDGEYVPPKPTHEPPREAPPLPIGIGFGAVSEQEWEVRYQGEVLEKLVSWWTTVSLRNNSDTVASTVRFNVVASNDFGERICPDGRSWSRAQPEETPSCRCKMFSDGYTCEASSIGAHETITVRCQLPQCVRGARARGNVTAVAFVDGTVLKM